MSLHISKWRTYNKKYYFNFQKTLSFFESKTHSVEIPEIYSHTFLAKNSWKHCCYKIKYLRIDFTKKYIFGEKKFLIFPHCGSYIHLLVFGALKEDQALFVQKRPYGKILGNGPYVTNIIMPQCGKTKIFALTWKIFRQNSSQCNFIIWMIWFHVIFAKRMRKETSEFSTLCIWWNSFRVCLRANEILHSTVFQ